MIVKINGKKKEIKKKSSLAELILAMGLCGKKIVMEHNLCIVPEKEWKKTPLAENDTVEIISFVGGG